MSFLLYLKKCNLSFSGLFLIHVNLQHPKPFFCYFSLEFYYFTKLISISTFSFNFKIFACSLLRRGLFVLWGGFCVVGRLGRKKKRARGARWSPARFLFLSIIDILMGIPSGSLCGGERLYTISSAALRSSRHQEVDLPTTNNSEIINADKYLGLLA